MSTCHTAIGSTKFVVVSASASVRSLATTQEKAQGVPRRATYELRADVATTREERARAPTKHPDRLGARRPAVSSRHASSQYVARACDAQVKLEATLVAPATCPAGLDEHTDRLDT
eukprot:COSAG02_NODE_615_length_19511_cov_64.132701_8_plen_116_part_00